MPAELPSKEMLVDACAGTVPHPHPILQAAYELASLHEARRTADPTAHPDIDRTRARLIHDIDSWTARELPRPHAAAPLHTETLGMVVDRLAHLTIAAHSSPHTTTPGCPDHQSWKRLAELSLAYADLAHALATRTCRIPDLAAPLPEILPPQQL
ncbi:DUF4254 domain-containing protein [Nocardia sp. 2]|uniref:DUF4254 domain-containing protein n=1 Tax=Nocardia acididurans TaxID=2802282 RepID=A0ABS1MGS4_9NOCA|nr:DUF4254 domain-containing protein [Nocardia acididurans]MBL1079863.1 DUF4254 domain-containing protein [Nocardia acididurans]